MIGFSVPSMVSYAEGWQQDGNSWWYEQADGSYSSSAWQKIGDNWYYFDQNGYMLTGWQTIGGKWYYLHADGAMAYDTWIDGMYYVGGDGVMLTNSQTPDGYYVENDGRWAYPGLRQRLNNTLCSEEWEVYMAYNMHGDKVPLTEYYGMGVRYMALPRIKFKEDLTFEYSPYEYSEYGEREIIPGTYEVKETQSGISVFLYSNDDYLNDKHLMYSTGLDLGTYYADTDTLSMPISDRTLLGDDDVSRLLFVHPSFYK